MTDVSPQEFLERLKDPIMSDMKLSVIEIIRDTKTQILEVSTEDYGGESFTIIVRLRRYD